MWPVLRNGSRGEDVRTVQYLLSAHGHHLDVDGVFGPRTEEGVRGFQSSNGLSSDGIVGRQTWPALVVQVALGDNGDAVRAVQSQLIHRGGFANVDGIFGPDTDDAVRRFQTKTGLVSDGIVGPRTWEALVGGGALSLEPQETAFHLFNSWTHDDPGSGRQVATEDAVATLFSRQWRREDGWAFRGPDGTAGHVFFVWERPGEELALRVPSQTRGEEAHVDQVLFRMTEGGL